MQIVLFRHGEPISPSMDSIGASDMKQWIAQYNSAVLNPQSQPSAQAIEIASEAELIVTSNLVRSKESAALLSSNQINEENRIFMEAGLPYASRSLFKAKPKVWLALFRVLWYLGYSSGSESKADVKSRSVVAAQELVNLANEYQNIALVGHGIFNRFIAKELKQHGFNGPKKPSTKYWGSSIYERQ